MMIFVDNEIFLHSVFNVADDVVFELICEQWTCCRACVYSPGLTSLCWQLTCLSCGSLTHYLKRGKVVWDLLPVLIDLVKCQSKLAKCYHGTVAFLCVILPYQQRGGPWSQALRCWGWEHQSSLGWRSWKHPGTTKCMIPERWGETSTSHIPKNL